MAAASPRAARKVEARPAVAAVARYKAVLRAVLDNRPSGTRQRLALALGKNRSFISQISNPIYAVPIPAQHLETIFGVCHFGPRERADFLAAYQAAHRIPAPAARPTGRAPDTRPVGRAERQLALKLPDLGSVARNRVLEDLLIDLARSLARHLEQL